MRSDQDLFKSREWLGTFFAPGDFDNRFSGTLRYSPEGGIVLSYLIPSHLPISPKSHIHGILDDGSRCTLIGDFGSERSGFTFSHKQATQHGAAGFYFVRMGDFYTEDCPVSEVMLSLTGLQEFFFPKGFKNSLRFSAEPEFTVHAPFGVLEVSHDASFHLIHDDIRPLFHSFDPDVLDELELAYTKIRENRKHAALMLKSNIAYRLHLKFDVGVSMEKVFEYISLLSGLFAILTYKPCHPENISIITANDAGAPTLHDLYPSLGLNEGTIRACQREDSHFNMPINRSTVDISLVIGEWFRTAGRFSGLASAIQNETGFRTDHATEGNIVLFATQLESIAHDAGRKTEKYEYPLKTHCSEDVQRTLKRLLGCTKCAELGVAIGDLRNEIAHIGRPRKYMTSLSRKHIFDISVCLELVVLGFVLDSIGVPLEARNHYQRQFLPMI